MLSHLKWLLVVTAVSEAVVGVLLLTTPAATAKLLLGAGLASPEALLVGRMAGAALFSIGLICWQGRNHRSGQETGLIIGLLVYNAAAVVLLLYAAVVDQMQGIGIWPTIVLHAALLAWCAGALQQRGLQQ